MHKNEDPRDLADAKHTEAGRQASQAGGKPPGAHVARQMAACSCTNRCHGWAWGSDPKHRLSLQRGHFENNNLMAQRGWARLISINKKDPTEHSPQSTFPSLLGEAGWPSQEVELERCKFQNIPWENLKQTSKHIPTANPKPPRFIWEEC
jgi:hypothetical protein